jgi:helix-turn-helix protein
MKDVPAKIKHKNTWIIVKMGITSIGLVIPPPINLEVPFPSIIDLAEKRRTLIITSKNTIETTLKIKSIDKVLNILKKMILKSCSAVRIVAYFKLTAERNGVPIEGTSWEKGTIVVVNTGIWFVTQARQVCVPLSDVISTEITKTRVKGKVTDMVRIEYLRSADVISGQVISPRPSLQEFFRSVTEATTGMDFTDSELDASDQHVAMLIYSGMDSRTIENMLNIPPQQLDAIYDKILNLGIAEVVTTRRELQLTAKGITDIRHAKKTKKR